MTSHFLLLVSFLASILLLCCFATSASASVAASGSKWTKLYPTPLCADHENIIFLNSTSSYSGVPLHRHAADFLCYSFDATKKQYAVKRVNGTTAAVIWSKEALPLRGLPIVNVISYRSMYVEFVLFGGTLLQLQRGDVMWTNDHVGEACQSSYTTPTVIADEFPWPGGSNPGLAEFAVVCTIDMQVVVEMYSLWNPFCLFNLTFPRMKLSSVSTKIVDHTLAVVVDGTLHAVDTQMGKVLWKHEVVKQQSSSSSSITVYAVDEAVKGLLMARVDSDGKTSQLHAFSARNGTRAFVIDGLALGTSVVAIGEVYNPPEQNDKVFHVADAAGRLATFDVFGKRTFVTERRHRLLPARDGAFRGLVAMQKIVDVGVRYQETLWTAWADQICWSEFWCTAPSAGFDAMTTTLMVPTATSSLAAAFACQNEKQRVAMFVTGGGVPYATFEGLPGDVTSVAAVMRDKKITVQFATTGGVVGFQRAI